MIPPNLNFSSISRKESLKSQKRRALRNRFFRTLLCSIDILNPGYNRKMLMRKRTSILDRVCFNYEQLFHPVQYTACKLCQCSSRKRLVLPEVTGILSVSDQFHYLWGINCVGNGTRQHSTCLYPSGISHILLSYDYILSFLAKIFLLWNQSFQCLAIVAFQLQSVYVFREKFLDSVGTTRWSPNFDFNLRKRFLLSPMFQLIWTRIEK